jgi:hypothetical protein
MTAEKIAMPWTADPDRRAVSRRRFWTGTALSGLATLFLVFDIAIKLAKVPEVDASMVELGWPTDQARPLGATLAACLALYVLPRTSALGALLLTGYLGGAVATHLRVGNPLASHTLFPIYVAVFLWAGLALRDDRIRGLLPRI